MPSPDPSGKGPPSQGGTAPGGSNPSTSSGQSAGPAQGGGSSGTPSDRDVGIATSRERGTGPVSGRGATGGAGVSRQDQGRDIRSSLSPFTLMRRLSEDMDRLFGDYSGAGLFPTFGGQTAGHRGLSNFLGGVDTPRWIPTVDVFQRGDNLIVHAELPGIKRDDVNVEINEGRLTLSGQREQKTEDDRGDTYRSERTFGSFYRAIPLPEEADADHAEAHFENGVLEVTVPIPKRTQQKAKKIDVT